MDLPHLRAVLRKSLPEHMIPSRFIGLSRLPVTRSGKIDRKALPDVIGETALSVYEPPSSNTERLVAKVFGELLMAKQVSRHDGFFALGGDSLSCIHLVTRLEQETGKAVAVRDVFEVPTVEGLAARIVSGPQPYSPLVRFRQVTAERKIGQRTIVCFPPAGGLPTLFGQEPVLRAWQPFGCVLGIQARGMRPIETSFTSYSEMLSCYISAITGSIATPLIFVGWSLGGKVAHDVATRLQALGYDIDAIVILDCSAVGNQNGWDDASPNDPYNINIDQVLLEFDPKMSVDFISNLSEDEKVVRVAAVFADIGVFPAQISAQDTKFAHQLLLGMVSQAQLLEGRTAPGYFHGPTLLVRGQENAQKQNDPYLGWTDYCSNIDLLDVKHRHMKLLVGDAAIEVAKVIATWLKGLF
ncbi:hypothetical protein E1297_01845 [Roseibium sp. RKSG952]|nr:hypothetical protein [Roseibium sp. RKSG952]